MADGCIFCRIVGRELPAERIRETERTLAILDIHPVSPGHVLVMPKAHHETLLDVPEELLKELIVETRQVARAVVRGLEAEGWNLLQNNHRCSGQAIPHVHMHVIPRRTGDGIKYRWEPKDYGEGEMQRIAEKVRKALEGEPTQP